MSARIAPEIRKRLRKIDATARDGSCWLVCNATRFALGKWTGDQWVFPMSGQPIGFEPTLYHMPEGAIG